MVDREMVLEHATTCGHIREPCPPQLASGTLDRRDIAGTSVEAAFVDIEVVEELVEDRVGHEHALVNEPRHIGQHRSRLQDAARLAECAGTTGHELEHERRQRAIELAIGERQRIGEGDGRAKASTIGAGQEAVGLGIRHRGHLGRWIDPDDRDVRPAGHGPERQLGCARPDVEEKSRATEGRLGRVEELGHGRRQDRRPPARVSRREPVEAFDLVSHPAIVPRPRPCGLAEPTGPGAGERRRESAAAASMAQAPA